MRVYQEQRRFRRIIASRPVLAVLFLLLVGMGVVTFRALVRGWEVREERRAVESKLEELFQKKEALSSELDDLKSGKGIEREAREKLNLRKPGEEAVIILEE